MRVVVDCAAHESEELVESLHIGSKLRLESQMPFADQTSRIPVFLEKSGECRPSDGQSARRIARYRAQRPLDLIALLVLPHDESRSRRRAVRRVRVSIGETDTLA